MSRAKNELPKNLLQRLATYRQALIANLDPALAIPSRGPPIGPAELVSAIDAFNAVCRAVGVAQQALQVALQARSRAVPGASALAERCKEYLQAALPPEHALRAQRFIRGPGGKHAIAAETHVKAAAARRQTRQRRQTLGKRQRAKLKAR